MKIRMKENKAITLVALVITVIVLLILAGVSIATLAGENGILNRSQKAVDISKQAEAREKLELVMVELSIDKKTDPNYNEDEYINTRLTQRGMLVEGDIVTVNEKYQFQIDRSVPKIGIYIGEGKVEPSIKLTLTQEMGAGKESAIVKVIVEYAGKIEEIRLGETDLTVPDKVDGKYETTGTVTENGTYYVIAKDDEGKYKTETINITGLGENLEIWTAEDLATFRDRVNDGTTFSGKTIKVMDNIDLSTECSVTEGTWVPIANYGENQNLTFKGTFEGNGKTISNLYINQTGAIKYQALFGGNDGIIQNLKITGEIKGVLLTASTCGKNNGTVKNITNYANVTTSERAAGGIAIDNNNTVENCYNLSEFIQSGANTDGYSYTGGILTGNYGTVRNCYNTANIIGSNSNVGGIASSNFVEGSIIDNCYNTGAIKSNGVNAKGNGNVGGITGYSIGTVTNSYNTGSVEGILGIGGIVGVGDLDNPVGTIEGCYNAGPIKATKYTGGIIGINFSSVKKCYNTASVTASTSNAGGIVGNNQYKNAKVEQCYNTGPIKSTGVNDNGNSNVGGIAGYNVGTVTNCYNKGTANGTRYIGGIVGLNDNDYPTAVLTNCYNTGKVTGTTYPGGILGAGISSPIVVSNNYFLQGTATYGVASDSTHKGATSKTSTQLQGLASTLGSAFVANNSTLNDGYPIFTWQQNSNSN